MSLAWSARSSQLIDIPRAQVAVGGGLAEQRQCGTLWECLAKEAKGDVFPMLCLNDSLRQDAPSVPQVRSMIEEAQTLTPLILAVWPFARVLARHRIA